MIVLGKITAPYGVRGAVRVLPFADDPAAWCGLSHWWLGRDVDRPDDWLQTRVLGCTVRNDVLIAEIEGIVDRTTADAYRGVLIGAPREALPPTQGDEYYWADLVGLEVRNTREQPLGCVLGLLDTPANAVLRVGDGQGAERLLPFVAAVVIEVDLPGKCMRVEWESDW